jgi:hypothetical protein
LKSRSPVQAEDAVGSLRAVRTSPASAIISLRAWADLRAGRSGIALPCRTGARA